MHFLQHALHRVPASGIIVRLCTLFELPLVPQCDAKGRHSSHQDTGPHVIKAGLRGKQLHANGVVWLSSQVLTDFDCNVMAVLADDIRQR